MEADRLSAIEVTVEEIKQIADEAKSAQNSYVAAEKATELKHKVEELGRLTSGGKPAVASR